MLSEVDLQLVINIVARVLHTTFAGLLLGGLMYQRLVLVPSSQDRSDDESQRRPWAMWVGVASGLVLLSGLYNTWLYLLSGQYEKIPHVYHALWGVKFLLALVLIYLAALLSGRSQSAATMRQRRAYWLNIAIVLAISLYALGAMMRTFPKNPVGTLPPTAIPAADTN